MLIKEIQLICAPHPNTLTHTVKLAQTEKNTKMLLSVESAHLLVCRLNRSNYYRLFRLNGGTNLPHLNKRGFSHAHHHSYNLTSKARLWLNLSSLGLDLLEPKIRLKRITSLQF